MFELAIGVAVGFLAGRAIWLAARPWFDQPALARPNYRGRDIPVGVGLVIPIAVFVVEAGRAVAGAAGVGDDPGIGLARLLTLTVVTGFCLLGAIDDVAGSGEYRGFRGHILALFAGQVTTGLFKLLGGAAVALVVVGPLAGTRWAASWPTPRSSPCAPTSATSSTGDRAAPPKRAWPPSPSSRPRQLPVDPVRGGGRDRRRRHAAA